jgi:hypothetical protein
MKFGVPTGRLVVIIGIIGACLIVFAAVVPSASEAAGNKRVCGTKPGLGYYNFIKARNVSCRIARRVSRQAGRNFCGHRYSHCSVDPGEYKVGRTTAKGWRCRMKIGYEFYRAHCKRNDQGFIHESAA